MAPDRAVSRGTVASSATALAGALAALSCCLPFGPFLLAAGFAGASGVLVSLQPYLIGFAVLSLIFGFVQALRAKRCGRRSRIVNIAVLVCSTGLVAVMLFAYFPASAPPGQPQVAAFRLDSFREAFNAAADHARLVVLLSPT